MGDSIYSRTKGGHLTDPAEQPRSTPPSVGDNRSKDRSSSCTVVVVVIVVVVVVIVVVVDVVVLSSSENEEGENAEGCGRDVR